MTEPFWFLLSAAFGLAFAGMTFAWLIAKRLDDPGIVNLASAVISILLAAVYFALGEGAPTRKFVLCALFAAAHLRLAGHLLRRRTLHPSIDRDRYARLQTFASRDAWLRFLGVFQLQAFLVVVLSAPVALVASNPSVGFGPWEVAGILIWVLALTGETFADRQLHAFRSAPTNDRSVCRSGLWRVSRHPNYFFHWLLAVAYFVFALGSPDGRTTFICPLLAAYFLIAVTGIPLTETRALGSRGDAYREYQRSTSAFVPWFPGRR